MANVIYLVEDYGGAGERHGLEGDALQSAIFDCLVIDRFIVQRTKSTEESVEYLTRLTKAVQAMYEVRVAAFRDCRLF